jgi:hypothetical protein
MQGMRISSMLTGYCAVRKTRCKDHKGQVTLFEKEVQTSQVNRFSFKVDGNAVFSP